MVIYHLNHSDLLHTLMERLRFPLQSESKTFLAKILVNSHFGRLRRPMLALRAMNLFGTDISLYVNLHRAKVFGTDIFLYVNLYRAKVFGTDIFLYVNLYRAKVFGTDICLGQTYEPKGKDFIQNFFISASIWLQTILLGSP